jgi:hypothetical protein
MSTGPAFASVGEAMNMARAALGYLAAADATQLAAETQAECLRTLERTDAISTAVRASFLSAFTIGQGYSGDADYSPRAWLIHKTRVSKGAAVGHTSWAKRTVTHPRVVAALAAGELSESYGRTICQWTDKLPEDCRPAADAILLSAAKAGMDLRDLAGLAAEMYERSRQDLPDEDPARAFGDRGVRLETTFQGAGVLNGDLTPECAAVVGAVLEALSAPAGAEDDRTREQRYHDALQEAMRRLVAANLLPERAGQPVKVWAHMSLADLLRLEGSSALQEEWTAQVRAAWAAHRAAASEGGRDGGAWLDGDAAAGIACDAAMAPVVTGDVNAAALEDLVRLCVELDWHRRADTDEDAGADSGTGGEPGVAAPDTTRAWEALERAIIGKAVDLLSGPGGLAAFLRRRQLGARLGGPSLPLDIGYSESVPAGIRNAVILRDRKCRWAGGCDQPAAACEVHHTKHKANGGPTSVKDCVLLCTFHHQVVIHRWGWTLVLNPDGTTTAWNKDKTRTRPRYCTATDRRPGPGNGPRTPARDDASQRNQGAASSGAGHSQGQQKPGATSGRSRRSRRPGAGRGRPGRSRPGWR